MGVVVSSRVNTPKVAILSTSFEGFKVAYFKGGVWPTAA